LLAMALLCAVIFWFSGFLEAVSRRTRNQRSEVCEAG
jgi:hypothetical protein